MSTFAIDPLAAALSIPIGVLCYGLYRYKQTFRRPQISVANLDSFESPTVSLKERYSNLPNLLKWIAFFALLLAFMDPKIHTERPNGQLPPLPSQTATEGIAIYLVLDQSGSMKESITVRRADGQYVSGTKVDLLRQATENFINGSRELKLKGRPNDLIGLVEFARTAHIAVPLTLDRKPLLDAVAAFDVVKDPSQDGTALGYAILKTARLITATREYARDLIGQGKPAYEIKNSVIILVTDGFQDPHPDDKNSRWRQMDPLEVANTIKDTGIHVYIVNIDPGFSSDEFAPHRRQLQKAAEVTGGKLFLVGSGGSNIADMYAAIDSIEKTKLPIDEELIKALKEKMAKENLPGLYNTLFLAPYLLAIAMICLLLGLLLESTLLRRVP
jgi:Ca-activated chloride channel homolog